MTGLVRKAMLFGVCGLFVTGVAFANVPSPANSTIPNTIYVVGVNSSGVPHSGLSTGGLSRANGAGLVVRDFTNNAIAGAVVVLRFTDCTDTRLCAEPHPAPAGAVTCGPPPEVAAGVTDVSGQVTPFYVIGAALNDATTYPAPNALAGPEGTLGVPDRCVEILADGVSLGFANAWVPNANGASLAPAGQSIDGLDLGRVGLDQQICAAPGAPDCYQRSDFDGDGDVDGLDLSEAKLAQQQSASGIGSDSGCTLSGSTTYCP